jgi:hypothetical protein
MKTEKNRYEKPELDAYLAQSFEEIKQQSIINAQAYAARNHPPLSNKKVHSYFEENHHKYQGLIDTINAELQFKSSCNEVVEHRKVTDHLVRILQNKLSAFKTVLIGIDAKLKNWHRPFSHAQLILAWVAIGIIALFEGLLATPVFSTWGYSNIAALLMGILFASVLAAFAHLFKKIVALGRTLWQRRAITAALLLLLTLLFSFMAIQRAEYLSKTVADNSANTINLHFSPIPFVCTSLLLFVVAAAVSYFFLPSKEQWHELQAYKEVHKAKEQNQAEQGRTEAEIAARHREHADVVHINTSLLDKGNMLEKLVISNAYGCFAEWKKQNMMHRSDNGVPVSFDDPNYPCKFNTNFHHLNLL